MRSSSSSSSSSEHISSDYNSINSTKSDVDAKTHPRIGGSRRDAELWKFRINDWFKREGITTDENKFSYIIAAAEDDIVRVLKEKEAEVNRPLTLDECVKLIKKRYWRENQKDNKLRQLKRIIIETVYDFNTRYLELYDLLETEDRASISVIDYENALRPRTQIYTKIAMEECDSLKQKNMRKYYRNHITIGIIGGMKEIIIIIIHSLIIMVIIITILGIELVEETLETLGIHPRIYLPIPFIAK